MMEEPVKLEFGQLFDGRSHPLWHYKEVPPGMRPATLRDLRYGRPVLYQVQIGPDAGEYYSGWYAGNSVEPLKDYIRRGVPVYVKD